MVEDLTVLLVGDSDPDEKLIEQLEKKNLAAEISSIDEFDSLLALVEPHIVVHTGLKGAKRITTILKETEDVRRVRLIVRGDRDDLPELRKLDRTVVVSVLATDIAPSVVAARVVMLAKKGPARSMRPPKPAKKGPAPTPAKAQNAPAPPTARPVASLKPVPAAKAPLGSQAPGAAKPPRAASRKATPPRADSLKATPSPAKPKTEEDAPISIEELEAISEDATSVGESPPSQDFPTMAVEAPVPNAARPSSREVRILLADSDVTRADFIACALREKGLPTLIVPLDAAATHWPLVHEFAPTILLADGGALKSTGAVWLQLFQADRALKEAKLVAVPFQLLFHMDGVKVNLRTLLPQIPQLSDDFLGSEPKPTAVPKLPSQATPTASRGPSAQAPDGPPAAAPPAFEDDDESEFERMTVARPLDEPLPNDATRGLEMPTPSPAAAAKVEPIPDSLRMIDGLETVPPSATKPVTDALGPGLSDLPAPKTTSRPASAPKSGGGLKLALVSLVILAAGAGGGWYYLGQKKLGTASSAPAPAPKEAQAPSSPPPEEKPEDKAPQAPLIPPKDVRWKISDASPAPECKKLVTNLDELAAGGVQQANLSLGRARKAMVRGELDEALKLMCEAVLLHPESLALEEVAALYVTKKSPKQAFKWYEQAIKARPDRPRTQELGGDVYNQLGRIEESRKAYIESLKVDGRDQKTLNIVAQQYRENADRALRSGALAQAELLYRRAAVLNPEDVDAAAGLAATYAGQGRKAGASAWAETTLEMDSGHHVALVVLAALATEDGDKSKAEELCNRALERDPGYPQAHQLLEQLTEQDIVTCGR